MTKIFSNNGTIEIPFPTEKFDFYLNMMEVSDLKDLTFIDLTILLTFIIGDFKTGSLCLDDMCEIIRSLQNDFYLQQLEHKRNRFDLLQEVLLAGSELSYTLRNLEKDSERFLIFMGTVMDFYDKRETVEKEVRKIQDDLLKSLN